MRKVIEILEAKDVKVLEVVSPGVSDKYVPIYTTDLMNMLSPEFKFEHGTQIVSSSNAHIVDLVNEDGDKIRILNSFDRSLALRISLVSDGVLIPLGVDRLVHIGQKAKGFKDEFEESKADILSAVTVAKTFSMFLKNTPISKDVAKDITETIFGHHKTDIKDITNYVDLIDDLTIMQYVNLSIKGYETGNYTYMKEGKKFVGKKKNSVLGRIQIENEIVGLFSTKYPEYFL